VRHFGRIEADPVSGKSGREQILQRMRNADVLLLLHGVEPICAEYIPSKMYEYLWMQRPIVGLVYSNAQMLGILERAGHKAIDVLGLDAQAIVEALLASLLPLLSCWTVSRLADSPSACELTTANSVCQLLGYAGLTSLQLQSRVHDF
jgi:hypothetical protein